MSASAFRGTYADWRLIKTRGVIQVIFEVPLVDADEAYDVLGGMPDASRERWFGIAALSAEKAQPVSKAKRDWRDMSPAQQAGIRCEEPTFAAFLKERRPEDWHESAADVAACVRLICGVTSRAYIEKDQRSRVIWKQLDDQYQAWKALEHA